MTGRLRIKFPVREDWRRDRDTFSSGMRVIPTAVVGNLRGRHIQHLTMRYGRRYNSTIAFPALGLGGK